MLRYQTETRPGLVALYIYDIRTGNGASQFYNPGACTGHDVMLMLLQTVIEGIY